MTITDEMVEKAKTTFTLCAEKQDPWDIAVRSALEAVAPQLIAQGMRETLACCFDPEPIVSSGEMVRTYRRDGKEIEEAILARIVSLSQKCIQTWDTMDTAPDVARLAGRGPGGTLSSRPPAYLRGRPLAQEIEPEMITDEIKRQAFAAAAPFFDDGGGDHFDAVSAALEAVGPMLVAQGMREAAARIPGGMIEKGHILSHSNPDVRAIYARAQELDPKYPLGSPI